MRFPSVRPRVLEDVGEDFFAPARPEPLDHAPGLLEIVVRSRANLLSCWTTGDYRAGVWSFRILGRQAVVANTPAAVKTVLATPGPLFERKSPQMRRALEALLGDGLFIRDGEIWRRRRPLVADLVHKSRIPSFAPTMEGAAAELAAVWRTRPRGAVFDMFTDMAALTAQIIARAVFGRRLADERVSSIVEGFSRYQVLVDNLNLGYFAGLDDGMPLLRGPRLKAAVAQVHGTIDEIVGEHLAGEGDEASMVHVLLRLRARRPELDLDIGALRNEAATIFLAGHETTAATLTWAWYLLSKAAWVERSVHEEIEQVCGDRQPSLGDVPRLVWCRAVIEETLRLYPPIPLLSRQAAEPTEIAGVAVEKAALVIVSPWLLHRAADLWERPERFEPERFIGGARPQPYSYIPFAAGARICAGMNFGLTESILCLATLAQAARVTLAPGTVVEPVCRLTLRPRGGLQVVAETRR